ncbi:MAG: MBL fold metallo-hydrolase [Candidatus Sungbacteria bacterium]|nr:MBL fold metallo-hydrolase [Candidatus Sungbacteria bacterium]
MRLSFHGGAQEVTGACYLLEASKFKILIDCGLFQGCDECADLNFEKFKFKPREIDAVFITHAHLDHVGRLPKLVREGFSGKIYSTAPTRELARLILEDALHLARRQKNELYREEDLEKTFARWEDLPYEKEVEIDGIRVKFNDAGHILGSATVEFWLEKKHFLFTGDLGNTPSALLPSPDVVRDIEYLIIESTYGGRLHEKPEERVLNLERAVEDTAARKGVLMIPAFATERTQDILFYLNEMLLFRRIPEMPVFVDSPLAIRATEVYERHVMYYKEEIKELYREHPHLFQFKKLKFTQTVEESKKINDVPAPKAIIAGSGMMQGGRILHHLRRYLLDEKSILLITGYQAAGSLGRRLIDKEKMVKLFGEEVPVNCEVRKINGFSAHADNPQLFSFVERTRDTLKKVFVVQGEEAQALHFMQEIKDRLGVEAVAPTLYESFNI